MTVILRRLSALMFLCVAGVSAAQETPGAPSAFGGPAPAPAPKAPDGEPAPGETPAPAPAAKPDWKTVGLPEKIAQLMLVTMEGEHQPSSADFGFLKRYTPAGAIVDRALDPQSALAYASRLRGVEQLTGLPFWVGGNLHRLSRAPGGKATGFPQIPSLLAVGAAHDPAITERFGRVMTAYMTGMGFNLHLGPSLCLSPRLPDALPAVQTFGGDAAFAAEAGKTVVAAFIGAGMRVAPVGFPGGGFDQREGEPAVLSTPREQLEARDLAPFLALLHDGVAMMHVDTTVAPTLDSAGRPSCLSAEIMDGLLRRSLGFEGLIVAGPLDAPELSGRFDPAEAALLALRGGADLLYWQTNPTVVTRVVDKLVAAVKDGLLDEAVVDRAFERVINAKLDEAKAKSEPGKEEKAKGLAGGGDIGEDILEIERHSITLLRNRGNLLPLEKGDGPIGVTGVVHLEGLVKKMEEYVKPIAEQRIATAQHLGDIQEFEIDRLTKRVRGLRTAVVVFTGEQRGASASRLVSALRSKDCMVVAVVLGHPALAMHLKDADAIVLGYCSSGNYATTLAVIGEALMGEGAVSVRNAGDTFRIKAGEARTYNVWEAVRMPAGRLPVHLGGEFPLGHSVSYDPAEAVKSVVWDFGDGTVSKETAPQHAFTQPGTYTVTLKVSDQQKQAAEGSYTFIVE
jgi:beta-N-acetylhexosaminidase